MTQTDVCITNELMADRTEAALRRLGEAFACMVGAAVQMGHVSPAGTTDYIAPDELTPEARLVWDAFMATRGADDTSRAAQRALVDWLWGTELGAVVRAATAEAVTR